MADLPQGIVDLLRDLCLTHFKESVEKINWSSIRSIKKEIGTSLDELVLQKETQKTELDIIQARISKENERCAADPNFQRTISRDFKTLKEKEIQKTQCKIVELNRIIETLPNGNKTSVPDIFEAKKTAYICLFDRLKRILFQQINFQLNNNDHAKKIAQRIRPEAQALAQMALSIQDEKLRERFYTLLDQIESYKPVDTQLIETFEKEPLLNPANLADLTKIREDLEKIANQFSLDNDAIENLIGIRRLFLRMISWRDREKIPNSDDIKYAVSQIFNENIESFLTQIGIEDNEKKTRQLKEELQALRRQLPRPEGCNSLPGRLPHHRDQLRLSVLKGPPKREPRDPDQSTADVVRKILTEEAQNKLRQYGSSGEHKEEEKPRGSDDRGQDPPTVDLSFIPRLQNSGETIDFSDLPPDYAKKSKTETYTIYDIDPTISRIHDCVFSPEGHLSAVVSTIDDSSGREALDIIVWKADSKKIIFRQRLSTPVNIQNKKAKLTFIDSYNNFQVQYVDKNSQEKENTDPTEIYFGNICFRDTESVKIQQVLQLPDKKILMISDEKDPSGSWKSKLTFIDSNTRKKISEFPFQFKVDEMRAMCTNGNIVLIKKQGESVEIHKIVFPSKLNEKAERVISLLHNSRKIKTIVWPKGGSIDGKLRCEADKILKKRNRSPLAQSRYGPG